VGDVVNIEIENKLEDSAIIKSIDDRKNYIIRISPHNKHQKHIIASNMHQALLIASIKQPRTSLGFIDRFLITAEMYGVPPILIFNKLDLLDNEDLFTLDYYRNLYEAIGYTTIAISAFSDADIQSLKNILNNKCTLFTGHSGVGKSTIVNALLPDKNIKVSAVSDWSGKGMHTTTYAEMHDVQEGTSIIDTPGIRELGIMDMTRAELGAYFPEIKRASALCKYNNCMHINEPQCAVLAAVNSTQISEERYVSYRAILDSIDDKGY
jgi:ribosome biogenesis GTPase